MSSILSSTSSLRVGGLVSGIDTEALVKELLKTEQNKVDKKIKERQLLEWKRDEFRTVNTKLLALRTSVADLKLESNFIGKTAKSSNDSILTATAATNAVPGTYAIKVKQLATGVTMSSQQVLGSAENVSSIASQFGIAEDTIINFTIAGKDGEVPFSFAAGDSSISDIMRIINDEDLGIEAAYDSSLDRVFLLTNGAGSEGVIKVKMDGMTDSTGTVLTGADGHCLSFLEDYLKLKVNDTTLNETAPASGRAISSENPLIIHDDANIVLSDMYDTAPAAINFSIKGSTGLKAFTFSDLSITLEEMITQINNESSNTGVNASYNSETGKVMLTSSGQITISDDTQNFLRDKLNMTIGSQTESLSSNSALLINDASNIKLNYLYTVEDLKFTLEGGLGNKQFSFNASAISNTTMQEMINSINGEQFVTGITAHYDGATGKIAFADSAPIAALDTGSSDTNFTLSLNEGLYSSSDGTPEGILTALSEGQDISSRFTYTGTGTLTSAIYHTDGSIDFTVAGAAEGDSLILNDDLDSFFDAEGNKYGRTASTFSAASGWSYSSRLNSDRMVGIVYDNEGFLADELNLSEFSQEGQKAIIDFNDAQNLEFDSNDITLLSTISVNLHGASASETVTITIGNDIDKAVEKVKAFIEVYNTTIVYMNTELTERRYNSTKYAGGVYKPLTAAQKEDMSEDEIKLWEDKAKSGVLRGDSILFSSYTNTRRAAMDPVVGLASDNKYTSLSSIGINTGAYVQSSLEGGKLVIDEVALRAALEDDADNVMSLFTMNEEALDDEGEAVLDYNGDPVYNKGIAVKLFDIINANMTAISTKAGSATASGTDSSLLSKEINLVNDSIESLEERMESLSERYWKQFTAMEKAMNSYNSQSSWLTSQLAQLSGSSS